MQLKKLQIYIVLMFTVFPAFDSRSFLQPTSDCHSCIRDAYFSTLLPVDDQWLCDICEIGGMHLGFITSTSTETILSGRDPVIPVFGAKPVIPFLEDWDAVIVSSSAIFSTSWLIRGLPNPLVTALLVPWKSDMKDFWARAQLAKWHGWHQDENMDASGYTARGRNKLLVQNAYQEAIADFDKTLSLAPQDPAAYYYRATAKLILGNAESALGNAEQTQRLYHAAIQDYTQVIALTPENTEPYVFRSYAKFRLGLLASAVGNAEQAERHYHAAISDCSQAMALYRKDETALKAALAVYTDVVPDYWSAVGLRDRYAFAYHLRGLGKQALGQHAAAEADFRKAKLLQPMP